MNSKSMFLIMAMAAGTLSSCVSNEDVYDPEKAEAMKLAKYEAAFVKKYGKVDPKQDWGFGEAEMQTATRTYNENANEWGGENSSVIVPPAVEQAEISKVLAEFDVEVKSHQNMEIKWSDFFIQQVYRNEQGHLAEDGSTTIKPSEKMNRFEYGESTFGNNGEIKENDVVVNGTKVKQRIAFFQSESWGKTFQYQCSEYNKTYGEDYYLIKKIGDSYYVGFDFQAEGQSNNQIVKRDYKFNDAIFKIVPAKYKDARRIMAEDLAVDNNSDFDFNDVVFDAAIVGNDAVITLQAVGGTLPLHIGTRDDEHEVHKLFGVEQNVFVNTVHRGEKAPVMFRLTNFGGNKLDDIAIYVDGQEIGQQMSVGKNAPAKLCCPTKYDWASETISIEDGFPSFKEAVGNHDIEWYEGGNESE